MATTMVRPMPLDGQYAVAQLWKLDGSQLFKGRYFQLSTMLAEYLMMPAFPSARFQDWADQNDRMPFVSINQVCTRMLAHEDVPRHLSAHADVRCCGWRTDGALPIYITYYGDLATYMTQREEVFGATAPFKIYVDDRLTDEENDFLCMWLKRYRCPYPFVYGSWNVPYSITATGIIPKVHPRLAALDEKERAHFRIWRTGIVPKPDEDIDDIVYNERIYVNGVLNTDVIRAPEV